MSTEINPQEMESLARLVHANQNSKPPKAPRRAESEIIGEKLISQFSAMIETAPGEISEDESNAVPFLSETIAEKTGMPNRYRSKWEHPTDEIWNQRYCRLLKGVKNGGIIAMIGERGTGKTRLSAEVLRHHARIAGRYTTAMGLFLRIRSTFGAKGANRPTEANIVAELTETPLLIIDEIQERGDSAWEDRILTHLLDARYGAMAPTIIIGNLTRDAMSDNLGDSISSRLMETGGVLEVTGQSFRVRN